MGISANVTGQRQIQASVGETRVDVSVAGGFGPSGAAASITVGTVTTGAPGSSASVVNAGSSSAAVLNFTIPAGATGSQGIQGEQGIQGVPGAVGPAGPAGPAGTTTWAGITDKPSTFPPTSHQHVAADISDFTSAVIAAATPTTNASLLTSGTLPDARLSSNIARTSDITTAVANVVNAAPASLDTLKELADALGNDASFATTVTNSLASKAPLANPTFTGTVSGVTKAMVGLGNVDNTADASKPVSTAQATADAAVASAAAADATSKANAAQAAAVQRANHTGTQTASTISDFASAVAAASPEEVVEYQTSASFPATGNASLLYLDTDASRAYRWAGGEYVEVGPSSAFVASHTHALADVNGLVAALDGKQATGSYVLTTDARLSDSREWSAATATQADAEAGTSTARLAFTPQRIFQAIAAWWAGSTAKTKLDGIATGATANATDAQLRDRSTHTGTQAATTITGLATVATSGSYTDLSNRPATFPPSAHTHPTGDITGLGTIATQNANSVAITGGSINGTTIGATTASTGAFTTVTTTGNVGIGRSDPSYKLDVYGGAVGNTAGNAVWISRVQADAANSLFLETTLERISSGSGWTTTAFRVQARVDATKFGYIDYLNGISASMAFGRGTTEFVRIDSTGNVGIGTTDPTISSGVGLHIGGSTMRLDTARTPASSTATGNTGEICWDSSYLYVCVATNSWRRIALTTF